MAEEISNIAYKKRCRLRGLLSSSTLYEADDHFLLVEGWVRQRFRRFYFDNIQAIITRPNFRSGSEYLIVGIPSVLFLFVALLTYADPSEDYTPLLGMLSPFVIILVFCFIRGLIRGGSQDVIFQTAVQATRIPPLGYKRQARRHLEEIQHIVETAQGGPVAQPGSDPLPVVTPPPSSPPAS